jgi:phosphoribosylamine--glycine ligase
MRILVVGAGGREHCLAWKLSQSPRVKEVYCAPGNGGTALFANNVEISPTDIDTLLKFAQEKKIDLTVVGPEAPLAIGIVDKFLEKGLKIFGPKKELAFLEASKIFAKNLMKKYNIPTADFEIFDNPSEAKKYVEEKGVPLVIKADGLAQGKGVFVCKSIQEAEEAIKIIMIEKKFADAGNRIVIEEFLEGEEASILIFTDGEDILPLVPSQDHKPVFDNDRGPNTGGMGAYSPAPIVNEEIFDKIMKKIFYPLIKGLKDEGKCYQGMLYAGLMIKEKEPFVLEFNVRFGDPETQAILPKLRSDIIDAMISSIEGGLGKIKLEWDERFCLCVVLASKGYPGKYEKGKEIKGLERLKALQDIFIFHAGTKIIEKPESTFITNGGRVLNVVGLGNTIRETQQKVYQAIESLYFEGMHYRRDIGNKALQTDS